MRHQAEVRKRVDHRLLQQPHVVVQAQPEVVQIHDRIQHDLPRPVIRHIPAAIRRLHIHAHPRQHVL